MKTIIILTACILLVIVSIIHFINANKAKRSLFKLFNISNLMNSALMTKVNQDFEKYSKIEDITFYIMLALTAVILLA